MERNDLALRETIPNAIEKLNTTLEAHKRSMYWNSVVMTVLTLALVAFGFLQIRSSANDSEIVSGALTEEQHNVRQICRDMCSEQNPAPDEGAL